MEIQIFGGINEIGGNKIFINASKKHFLFDYGLSFNDRNEFFADFLNPRRFNGIIDYLYLKLIPSINQIYRNDLIKPYKDILKQKPYNITETDENIVDAFFLTHPHMDHYKFIGFLKQDTPIYMTWVSKAILEFIAETSIDPDLNEILKFHEQFKMVKKKTKPKNAKKYGYKRATKRDYSEEETKRSIKLLGKEKPIIFKGEQGDIEIEHYTVDHSIAGACAYIVKYDGQSIVYTGDFRYHGLHPEWIDNFVENAKKSNPIAIITEGTRIPSIEKYNFKEYHGGEESEDDVKIRSRDMIRSHPGLILVNFPMRNLDRVLMYYKLAKKYDRIFAIDPKIYRMIDNFKDCLGDRPESDVELFLQDYPLPENDDEHIAIYLRRKGWGRFERRDYRGFEQKIFKNKEYITFKEIQKEPERYMLYLNFYMLGELIDINPDPNTTIYINSITDPFNEEMEIQERKLDSWLEHFGILKTETIHSSGHMCTDHLRETLDKINADNIIPIHTDHPETFEHLGLSGDIIIPELKKKYNF
ncbi:MAG: MBL fold metallo-hydrolase [Candidatus Lokiarchaeota archaeon]|nr:MBL fold metallo-hydrolase [Candidatus Lokiarchaeota archaeon]